MAAEQQQAPVFLLLLLLCAPLLAWSASDAGVVYLDDLTFDKVVDGTKHTLVRFDKEYPWGDAHEAFKKAAKSISSSSAPVLVAGVPISNNKDYPVNPTLAARFQLQSMQDDAWPVFKLFKAGAPADAALTYPQGAKVSEEALVSWVVREAGVFVAAKGQVEALHKLAQKFMAAAGDERSNVLQESKKAADVAAAAAAGHKPFVEYYVKSMSRVLEKGDTYVSQEEKRLRRVMDNDKSITADKKSTFEWRLNILASFAPAASSGTEL